MKYYDNVVNIKVFVGSKGEELISDLSLETIKSSTYINV